MKIAITGGIGCGKSYVCKELSRHGIEVYDCDAGAKRLMRNDANLKQALVQLVGEAVYDDHGILQKRVLAAFLLQSEENKQAVNDVIHPAVARDFERSGLGWLESAILFDSGFDRRTRFDKVICIVAPLEVRIRRIMVRDGISREKALEWIHAQLPQEEVLAKSDFGIVNDGVADIPGQVRKILEMITENINKK